MQLLSCLPRGKPVFFSGIFLEVPVSSYTGFSPRKNSGKIEEEILYYHPSKSPKQEAIRNLVWGLLDVIEYPWAGLFQICCEYVTLFLVSDKFLWDDRRQEHGAGQYNENFHEYMACKIKTGYDKFPPPLRRFKGYMACELKQDEKGPPPSRSFNEYMACQLKTGLRHNKFPPP